VTMNLATRAMQLSRDAQVNFIMTAERA